VYDRLAELIRAHHTTLCSPTPRQVERVTLHLSERLGKENVCASWQSVQGTAPRLRATPEVRPVARAGCNRLAGTGPSTSVMSIGLPAGQSRMPSHLPATRRACQPRGRRHPKGRLFPLSRDDLVECAALLDSVQRGELDRLIIPPKPLDVLAQQIVAEVAARDYGKTSCMRWLGAPIRTAT